MPNNELNGLGQSVSRTAAKAVRRLIGLVLLSVAIGMSTCSALDGVREPSTPTVDGREG